MIGDDINYINNNIILSFQSKNLLQVTKHIPIPTNIFNVWNQLILPTLTPTNKWVSLSSNTINNMLSNKDGFKIDGFTLGHMRNIMGSIVFERACIECDGTVEEKVEAGVVAVMAPLDQYSTKCMVLY